MLSRELLRGVGHDVEATFLQFAAHLGQVDGAHRV